MKQITINVYQFDELSEEAKEKARTWWKDGFFEDTFWSESTIEDAKEVGFKITEWDLNPIGASGEFLESARETADLILKNHGDTCETFKLAETFLKQRDELVNMAEKDENGELVDECGLDEKLDELESEFQRDLAHEYACMLDREVTYQMSDEYVDGTIRANEYEFLENGKRA